MRITVDRFFVSLPTAEEWLGLPELAAHLRELPGKWAAINLNGYPVEDFVFKLNQGLFSCLPSADFRATIVNDTAFVQKLI